MKAINLARILGVYYLAALIAAGLCLARASHAHSLDTQSVSVRSRVSEKTLLGADAPEDFEAIDVAVTLSLPSKVSPLTDLDMGARLMASAGFLRGADENALVISLVPGLSVESDDGRFSLDVGVGGAWFSRYVFGVQDFGGPFQFALTLGVAVPLYEHLGLAYRFLHYSDAGLNGSGTTGADFHMIEVLYRFW